MRTKFSYIKDNDGRKNDVYDYEVEVQDVHVTEEDSCGRHTVTSHPVRVKYLEGVVPPIPPLSQWPIIPTGDVALWLKHRMKKS